MYKTIIVDVFNVLHRLKKEEDTVIDLTNSFIDYYLLKIKPITEESIHLLFDPIPKSDMGISKCFKITTDRQEILSDYKANRKFCQKVTASAKLVKQYFQHRGENIKSYVSDFLEADDFVETIIKKYEDHVKIALLTTDLDWAKYLTPNIIMLNKLSGEEYTIKQFEEKHGYIPTVASVSLDKAFFGDKSDNITGAASAKPNKALRAIYPQITEYIKYIAKTGDNLSDIIKRLKAYNFVEITKKETRTVEEDLWVAINSGNAKVFIMSSLMNNLRVIKSRCKNADRYMSWNPENEKINNLLEATLGRTPETKKKFKFGNAK